MQIDLTVVAAILGVGLMGIIQTLKRILKLQGVGAIVLTLIVSFLATAVYLLTVNQFDLIALIVYGFLVFGEASGLYHILKK